MQNDDFKNNNNNKNRLWQKWNCKKKTESNLNIRWRQFSSIETNKKKASTFHPIDNGFSFY